MAANALQRMSDQYLTKLYELSEEGLKPQVDVNRAISEVGFSQEDMRSIHRYLESKDLISWKCTVGFVLLTTRAIDAMQNSYEAKEILVLKKIYELSSQNTTKPVFFPVLEPAMSMGWHELSGFLKGLEERGYVSWAGGDVIYITRDGIDAIDSLSRPKSKTGGDTYNTTIGTVQGATHIGPGGTQNVQFNYQPISEIIPQLTQLIETVRKEDFDTKDDVLHDLEIAHQVALANPNATAKDGAWTRIQTKLTAAKTTMELAGFVVKTYPYWPQIWDFFHRHIR